MRPYLARPMLLSALLLATLSGCAIYDPRPQLTGSSSVNTRTQDQATVDDRAARIAYKKELAAQEERERIVRYNRYFE
ncbi:MAG: hypothetical protein ABI654_01350 [Betaproteobacteria bacterium]